MLSTYPDYKHSNLPFWGEIPSHWQIVPIKHRAHINIASLPENTSPDYQFDYLDIGAVGTGILNYRPKRIRFYDSPSRARRIVRQGDTIISTVRTYLKAVYFIAESYKDLIVSTGFAVFSPRHGIEPKYLSYLLQSEAFTSRVSSESVGVAYPAIAETRLGSLKVGIPTIEEQQHIVRFIDYYNHLFDQYVLVKKQQIKLISKQGQLIVQRAVTRGLDLPSRLKPSGIDWLEEIPEHWDVRRLKNLFREIDDKSETGTETLLSLRMYQGLVPHNDVSNKPITSNDVIGFKRTQPSEIVMNRMRAANGMFAVTPILGIVSPDYAIFRQIVDLNPNYFVHLFKAPLMRAKFRSESKGLGTGQSGFLRLYSDRFGVVKVPVPPLEEQNAIVAYLDDELRELNHAIEKINDEVKLIREYRTRLISDVVTGKIDVREAARNLPEATFVDEPVEESDSDEELNDDEDLNDISLEENNA